MAMTLDGSSGIAGGSIYGMFQDSAGRIRMPNQPSFSATKSDGLGSGTVNEVIWPTVLHNIGGCYNPANGRFTAPVAGRYFFSFMMLNNTTTYVLMNLAKNGSSSVFHAGWLQSRGPTAGNDGYCSMSLIANLATGDYVSVICNASYNIYYPNGYCSFNGHFLG